MQNHFDIIPIKADLLRRSLSLPISKIKITGDCLVPYINPGDFVEIVPFRGQNLEVGQLIVVLTQKGVFCHRLIYFDECSVITKGDNTLINDSPIPLDNVIGVVSNVVKPDLSVHKSKAEPKEYRTGLISCIVNEISEFFDKIFVCDNGTGKAVYTCSALGLETYAINTRPNYRDFSPEIKALIENVKVIDEMNIPRSESSLMLIDGALDFNINSRLQYNPVVQIIYDKEVSFVPKRIRQYSHFKVAYSWL